MIERVREELGRLNMDNMAEEVVEQIHGDLM
jgi:hypothetical protein